MIEEERLDPDALALVGERIAQRLRPGDMVMLSGDLGAGKTTLARAILGALGHGGEVPSPTYMLVEPYPDLAPPILHADLYRLDPPVDAAALGFDEWLETGAILVEWPERLDQHSFPDALRLRLEGAGGPDRRLTWDVPAAWKGRWPPAP